MDADENAIGLLVRDRGARGERDIAVIRAREHCGQTARLKKPLGATRHVQRQIFFDHAALHRPGIQTAVSRIDHDEGERLFARRRLNRKWKWGGP